MITSIFGKTKPVSFIIILTFLFVFYWTAVFLLFSTTYNPEDLIVQFATITTLLSIVVGMDFIVKRYKLTEGNSFTILFFTLFILIFPEVLLDYRTVFCCFFLLLATGRLLSIKSLKQIKMKLFDATLWVGVSSLFYDWALLYLLLVFVAIYLYEPKNIQNWLVPIVGTLTVFIISLGILTILNEKLYFKNHYQFSFDMSTGFLTQWTNSMKLVMYIIIALILGMATFIKFSRSGQGRQNTMRLVTNFFFIGLLIILLTLAGSESPILFTFFPASVFISNYIESIRKPKTKEWLLIGAVLFSMIMLAVGFL